MSDKKRTPTVIGGGNNGGGCKSTTLGDESVSKTEPASVPKRPTLLSGSVSVALAPKSRPTTLPPSTAPAVSPKPAMPKLSIGKPTIMPGTVRNGIEASVADLERVCPRIPQRVIERARSILRGTFTDTLTSVTCSEWGMAAQQQYGELVEQSLAIMSDSRLESGIAHAVRLQALLTEIGEAVEENASGGLLDRVWRRRNPREMLEEHKSEIDKIKGLLKGILPSLRNAQMHLEEINVTAEMLAAEIDAWSVSALYLADLLGQGVEHVDDLLVQGRALMGTVASIREGILARRANAQQVNVLADRIQEVVLGSLPSLLEGITVRLIQKTLSPTDRRTIVEGVQEIINHLKI